jgi:hypothetical protein
MESAFLEKKEAFNQKITFSYFFLILFLRKKVSQKSLPIAIGTKNKTPPTLSSGTSYFSAVTLIKLLYYCD